MKSQPYTKLSIMMQIPAVALHIVYMPLQGSTEVNQSCFESYPGGNSHRLLSCSRKVAVNVKPNVNGLHAHCLMGLHVSATVMQVI